MTYDLKDMKKDSERSLGDYRVRKFLSSKWGLVLLYTVLPFYMLAKILPGKKSTSFLATIVLGPLVAHAFA